MRTAIIGHTGFVGSNLAAAHPFDDHFNTANIDDIRGRSYDLVVSAAARADSHRINQDGPADRAEIDAYCELLSSVSIDKLVFVSTVCVYPGGTSPDEQVRADPATLTPYGANRLHMEDVLGDRFDSLALRLPQLYGRGLKKGIVYDLLNHYRVEFIRPGGWFQYYDLARLWSDTQTALRAGLRSLNVATPPLRSDRVAADCFGIDIADQQVAGQESPFAAMYTRDMRTAHADLFGGPSGYLVDEATAVDDLRRYVAAERAARGPTGDAGAP